MAAVLFVYAFLSNVALAVVPHEPVVMWFGARLGVWPTAAVATAGTLAASWVDHRLFVPLVSRAAQRVEFTSGPVGWVRGRFARALFAILALSGITPLPFYPFKALAFAARYPMGRYLAAIAAGRLPRYLLLAWLGVAIRFPPWVLGMVFLFLLIPSLKFLPWNRENAS